MPAASGSVIKGTSSLPGLSHAMEMMQASSPARSPHSLNGVAQPTVSLKRVADVAGNQMMRSSLSGGQ